MVKTGSRRRSALAHYGELARLGKAMASPVRLQLLDLLRQGSRTVEDLAGATDISVANSSRHLQQMRSARLVTAHREGRHVRYRLADGGVSETFGMLRTLAETLLPEMDRLRRELGALEAPEREALLAELGRGGSTLIDVRPAAEFEAGHLPGARSIPFDELPSRLGEIPRDRPVVAYCRGPYCPLALEAAELLNRAGHRAQHLDLGVPDLALPGPRRRSTALHRTARKSR